MSFSDRAILVIVLIFSLIGVTYLPVELKRRLKDPRVLSRVTTSGGLRTIKIYYWIGIICSAFLVVFLSMSLYRGSMN
jgi:hypothetical protein